MSAALIDCGIRMEAYLKTSRPSITARCLPARMSSSLTNGSCIVFSSRRRHTRFDCDWSSDVCSSDLMEIVRERLEREFNLDLISTVPNVEYHVHKTDGTVELVENPSLMPHGSAVDHIEEPYVKARIVAPAEYIGAVMKLGQERRGVYQGMPYVDPTRVEFGWEFPLAEIILDFYDKLKTISRGYASLDYEFLAYRPAELVKLDMLLNGEAVDAFSVIIHRDKAYEWGKKIAEKLKELIPRQLFEVVIQAAIGTKVIARETVRPLRKNVTAKCYGGDVTRKRKLLEKQKEGKKRMKQVGTVEIPQEAFLAVLQVD